MEVEQLTEDSTEQQLRTACEKARSNKVDELALVFTERVRLSPQIAATIVEALTGSLVTKLRLVQKSPSIGFFASSVQLRMPKVVVSSHRDMPS